MTDDRRRSWSRAWRQAHSSDDGFYRTHRAEEEFSTGVRIGDDLAAHFAGRLEDRQREWPDSDLVFIDIGAGDGSLLSRVRRIAPEGIAYVGVDMRPRPAELDGDIDWIQMEIDSSTADITGRDGEWTGILVAHEFLDDIPCEVLELDDDLLARVVLVDPQTGVEEIGPHLRDPAAHRYLDSPERTEQWLADWWPATRPLARREVGLERDRVWARLRRVIGTGQAIAVDYAHRLADRQRGLWDGGTLRGFAAGRPRSAVPDGTVNITAHVALDACASHRARMHEQSRLLPGLAGFPGGLGSYEWLVEPRRE